MDASEIIGGVFSPTGPAGPGGAGLGAGATGPTGESGGDYSRTYSCRGTNSTSSMEFEALMNVTTANGDPIVDSGLSFQGGGGRVTSGTGIAGMYKVSVTVLAGVQGPFEDQWEVEVWLEKNSDDVKLPGSRMRITINGENGIARRRTFHRAILVELEQNDYVRCIGEATDQNATGGTATFGGECRFNMELVNAD